MIAVAAGAWLALLALTVDGPQVARLDQPAPSLDSVRWITGEPIDALDDGRVRVLAFFSAGDGESIDAISDHHRLAHEMKGRPVDVIGVAVGLDDALPTTEALVDGIDELDYRVCEDRSGDIAWAYLEAHELEVPVSFILDGEGLVRWVDTHERGLFDAVAAVLDGTFDADRFEARQLEIESRATMLFAVLDRYVLDQNWKGMAKVSGELVDLDRRFRSMSFLRYTAYINDGRPRQAARYGAALYERFADDAFWLNELSWTIVDPDGELAGDERDLGLALQAAKRSAELCGRRRDYVLDTLARCHFELGDVDTAISVQREALSVSTLRRDQLEAVLEEYESHRADDRSGR